MCLWAPLLAVTAAVTARFSALARLVRISRVGVMVVSGAMSWTGLPGKIGDGGREFLSVAGSGSLALALGGWAPAAASPSWSGSGIRGHHPNWVPREGTLERWLEQLHAFGPVRATGTPQARAFEEWLADRFGSLGCHVDRDPYRLTSWEADVDQDCSISIVEDDGSQRDVGVVGYFPFAATTRGTGPVSGRVLYAGSGPNAAAQVIADTSAEELAEAVVVIDMPIDPVYSDVDTYDRYPASFPDPLPTSPLRPASGAVFFSRPDIVMNELDGRCRGLVLCYTNISNEAARHNYLPFSGPHRRIPGLWVGADGSSYLQSVSGRATLTMRLDATLTPDARTDTLIATLPGRSDDVIFMTSHTDGPNEVNDNGALGLLALATYAARVPRRHRQRTHVFALPTGHYARGALADPDTGSGKQAGTPGVLRDHPEITERIVAHMAIEQMAAREWLDLPSGYGPTGLPAYEMWIPTPDTADTVGQLFLASTEGEDPEFSRSALAASFPGGEGASLRAMGIPGIGLMGFPHYFFIADPEDGVIGKLDPQIMHNQVSILSKLMVLMDRLSVDQLNGQAAVTDEDLFGPPGLGPPSR